MDAKKVAIVTAANRGIGAGCARELAARGYTVSLMARSESVVDLAKELGGMATLGSIANPQDLQRLIETTLNRMGRIDAVINRSTTYAELAKTVAFLLSDDANYKLLHI